MPTLSIVIPTYRGSATVPRLLEGIWAQPFPNDLEVVIVDDGSPDESAGHIEAWLESHSPPIGTLRFIELARNFGEHNAVMAGLLEARGDLVLTMDDDMQHRPEDAFALFRRLECDALLDVVYGQLVDKQHAAWRNIGSRASDRLLGWLVGKPRDVRLSTFRCLRRRVVNELLRYAGPFPYIDGLVLQQTSRIAGHPVDHLPRVQGRSGYRFGSLARLFLTVATGFSVQPLRLSLLAGILLGASGFVMGAYAVVYWFLSGTVSGWTSVFVAVTLLSGAQLLMIGFVGEYVGRILLTVNGRPQHARRSLREF